jgi:DNA-binding HxlR family transcriptional regulator
MVLREIFLFKVRRFDEFCANQFCANQGIARASLEKTLSRLVRHGVLERRPINADRRRMGYFPTGMGEDLLAPLIAARNWGTAWCAGNREPRQGLEHGI